MHPIDDEPSAPWADMPPEELQRWGYRLIDWIADYLRHPERYPVLSRAKPGEIRSLLPSAPPERPESMEAIFRDFREKLLPGITHWNHPSFFAYFAITGSGPGILGELLMAALNVNAMLWRTSPSATELEELALDWLRQMLGLPEAFYGVIFDTASLSTVCSLAAARESVPGLAVREQGLAGRPELKPLRLYTSEQAHSSIDKAALLLGIGRAGIRKIPVDKEFRMEAEALDDAIEEDLGAGWLPFSVVATVGTTSTTSIDPVPAIADICEKRGLWLHVDAAYGGSAAILPEMKWVLEGCERADSLVVNPHKWLTPIDLSTCFCRRPEVLREAFSLIPEYLKSKEEEPVTNYMDYGIQLGRRFRALKLWMVIRYFGVSGLSQRIREHMRLAQKLASWIDADPDFERLAPTPFSTVCFRACPRALRHERAQQLDRLNEELLDAVNATGEAFLSHTRLHGRFALRMAISNLRTTGEHVSRAWELLRTQAGRLADRRDGSARNTGEVDSGNPSP
ncbi:MAG: pyridoxal phosphate-dependent decarboxylase family protein [Acidobacteriota bacterium]